MKKKNNIFYGFLPIIIGSALILTVEHPGTANAQTKRIPGILNTERAKQLQQRQVPIGTTVSGTISSPILWTNNFTPETQAKIKLNEPLLFADDNIDDTEVIALPEGSFLTVQVANWDSNGFVNLNVVGIEYKNDKGETIDIELPSAGILQIRDEDGTRPLAFQTKSSNQKSSLAGDILGGALETGARNLPVSRTIGNEVSRAVRNGNRARRSRRRSNRNVFYTIEKDTKVSIYVNGILSINQ